MKFIKRLSIFVFMLMLYLPQTSLESKFSEVINVIHCEMAGGYDCLRTEISVIPLISNFWPQIGPWEGGTNVTIKGEALEYKFEDINQGIKIAGVACTPYRNMYVPEKSITCVINKPRVLSNHEGPIEIQVKEKIITSKQNFTFVNPKITDIYPKEGPTYGGTELTIKGENLNAGGFTEVLIGNISCTMFSRDAYTIQCITDSSHTEKEDKVFVNFDGNIRDSNNNSFKYVKNRQRDRKGFNYELKGIPAGGIKNVIRNVNLSPTQRLQLHIWNKKQIYNSSCKMENDSSTTWTCLSPFISDIDSGSIDAKNPTEMNVSFSNGTINEQISFRNQPHVFLLYPNPVFNYFLSGPDINEYNTVIIIGQNIDKACQSSDINVKVGNDVCEVTSISSIQVVCGVPKFPLIDSISGSEQKYNILAEHHPITVSIGNHFNVSVPEQSLNISPPENSVKKYIISGIVAFVSVILLIIAFHFISRKKNKIKYSNTIRNLQQEVNVMGMEAIAVKQCMKRVIIKNKITLNENLSKILKLADVEIENTSVFRSNTGTSIESEYIVPPDNKWEFHRNNLTLGRCLGKGEFGKVVQAEAKNIFEENITLTVAVKMLKDDHCDNDMIDLVSEMEIMKLIETHVNVLRLLGCCTQNGPLFIITEYAQHGNLCEFLRKHLPSDGEIDTITLSQETLIKFAIQVAKGMEHLASIKCIHRDLAARNVLVSEGYILKIADFGLSRDIRNKEYYKRKSDGRVPVKWMAPESLCHNIYSTQSDVHTVMRNCWSFQPKDRSSFSSIVSNLQDALSNHEIPEQCNFHWPEREESINIENETDPLL